MSERILADLKTIVDIDTSKLRNIKSSFAKLRKIAKGHNLNYEQYNHKILLISNQEINLDQPYCAIITHIDVVGINKNSWEVPAFDLQINQDWLVGRGIIDNKSCVISAMYTLKNLPKTNLPWVLIVGSTEEVSMDDIGELFEKEPQPQISFTPDGLFDVCISEPHIITCDFELENTGNDVFKSESKYYNVVCGNLRHNGEEYIGKATHISDIDDSLNALYLVPNIKTQKLNNFIKEIKNNKIPTINSSYFNTFNIGFVTTNDSKIQMGIDIRIDGKLDIEKEYKMLKTHLEKKYNGKLTVAKVFLRGYNHSNNELFLKYAKGKKIYEAKGGTYARKLKNCFVIGPQDYPDTVNGPHSDNERILKSDFLKLPKRFEKALLELDSLIK